MTRNAEILSILINDGIITSGHFKDKGSGRHSSLHFDKEVFHKTPVAFMNSALTLAQEFMRDNVEIVISYPNLGGIILCNWVVAQLERISRNHPFPAHSEYNSDGTIIVARGHEKLISKMNDEDEKKRVLVVGDIIEGNGQDLIKLIDTVRISGGDVVGVGVVWNQGCLNTHELKNIPKLFSILDPDIYNYQEWSNEGLCSVCKRKA